MRGSRVRAAWLAVLGIALAGCAHKPGVPLEMLTWDRDFPPHRVAGNVYFVGRKNVGIFLITTPAGHILLDSGFEASVPAVQASVQQLGFASRTSNTCWPAMPTWTTSRGTPASAS
jgi:metallo-beta-lactamase class B